MAASIPVGRGPQARDRAAVEGPLLVERQSGAARKRLQPLQRLAVEHVVEEAVMKVRRGFEGSRPHGLAQFEELPATREDVEPKAEGRLAKQYNSERTGR
jgi:hypothetical protein